jgi:hypothetical protein
VSVAVQATLAVIAGAVLLVLLTEAHKRTVTGGYFAISAFLLGFGDSQPTPPALLLRALIPASAGVVAAALSPSDAVVLGAFAALGGTLSITWPVFLSREAIPVEIYGREGQLRFLHVMNSATALALGAAGGITWAVIAAVGGGALLHFAGEIIQELLVMACAAVALTVLGLLGIRFGAKQARLISAGNESDAETGDRLG